MYSCGQNNSTSFKFLLNPFTSTNMLIQFNSKKYLLYYIQGPPNNFFLLENGLKKNYWIFSQISFFIWKYNPFGYS